MGSQVSNCCGQDLGSDPNGAGQLGMLHHCTHALLKHMLTIHFTVRHSFLSCGDLHIVKPMYLTCEYAIHVHENYIISRNIYSFRLRFFSFLSSPFSPLPSLPLLLSLQVS